MDNQPERRWWQPPRLPEFGWATILAIAGIAFVIWLSYMGSSYVGSR